MRPHFHNVVADGVFALGTDGQAVFFPATELCDDVFARLQETLRKRILMYFCRHGYLDSDDADNMLQQEYGGGFSLHGGVRIDDSDREGQEKLLRYCARPTSSVGIVVRRRVCGLAEMKLRRAGIGFFRIQQSVPDSRF